MNSIKAKAGRAGALYFLFLIVGLVDMFGGMPKMSGWELARSIRERNAGIPLAILTGWAAAVSLVEQEAAGVNWIVAKPFLIERIAEIVKEISERHLETPKTPSRQLSLVA